MEVTRPLHSATEEMVPGHHGWEGLVSPLLRAAMDWGPPGEMAGWGAGKRGCWPLHCAPGPKAHAMQRVSAEGKDKEQPSLI